VTPISRLPHKKGVENAVKTESTNFKSMEDRLSKVGLKRLLHAGMGLSTEAGEFLDALKKHIFYGKELDRVNLAEEMGDVFWYCAIVASELGINFEEVMAKNIEKLKARYREKFTAERADTRDLEKERSILEKQNFQ